MPAHTPVALVDARTTILGEAGFSVSELSTADIDEYVALIHSAYRGEESGQGWTSEAHLLGGQRLDATMTAELLAEEDSTVLLVRNSQGQVVASVYIRRPVEAVAYLGTLAVSPQGQGQGVGSALINLAEAWVAEKWQATAMRMVVISRRAELIAYYQRRGYELTGVTEPFPYGDERFGKPKFDDLEFIELVKTFR